MGGASMSGNIYDTPAKVLKRAQEAIGKKIKEIDATRRIETGKGAIGTVIEESWFGYRPNSTAEPDFPEAGVELKVTPYRRTSKGISAKERLVCNIIDYMSEHEKTFETSSFWHKCQKMLIMSYEYKEGVEKDDFSIDNAVLFAFPDEYRAIIKSDWEKIVSKIRAGEAHLLTEGDTLYLAACTKGKDSNSVRDQPFSDIPAKQRAYSLKSSFMTNILRRYIFGYEDDEKIIKDWRILETKPLEDIIAQKVSKYIGKTREELKSQFDIYTNPRNLNMLIFSRMIGLAGDAERAHEFENANIIPKTICVEKDGNIKESMSFPAFKFCDIINETWEDSELRNLIEPAKFLFVIFKKNDVDEPVFERIKFWNIPAEDLEEVKKVWKRTVSIIKAGVQIKTYGQKTKNNLPKSTESYVAHVRPHARNKADTYPLPDGRELTKQCFWFNSAYVKKIIAES